jgi:hypothetical protein
MRLRYEDLVAEPETWVRRLSEHVGVEFVPAMLEVERANTSFVQEQGGAPRRRGIFSTSAERWRTELTPTEIWIGERICGDVMRPLGYETSANGLRPSPAELAKIAALLPARAFNLLFRTGKPFTWSKLARVLTLFRRTS